VVRQIAEFSDRDKLLSLYWWEKRRKAFETGLDSGIDQVIQSSASLDEEKQQFAKLLTIKLALFIEKFGNTEGHKQFVTWLFRSAYSKGNDPLNRKTWSLDWPEMRIESIFPSELTGE
jgi:hypothetical protein